MIHATELGDGFNVADVIREEMQAAGDADPSSIALRVSKRVPEDILRDVLAEALVHQVRVTISNGRSSALRALRVVRSNEETGEPDLPSVRPRSRWKGPDGAGAVYLNWMHQLVFCGEGGWKQHSDCSLKDLQAAAESRMAKAKATAVEGKRYEMLAAALAKAKKPTVGALPELVVLQVLRWQP